MKSLFSLRALAPLALAALCCSCTSEEEKADAAFAELCTLFGEVELELAAVNNHSSAEDAAAPLSERGDELHALLERITELGDSPELPQEARRRLGEKHHEGLRASADAALAQAKRLIDYQLYRSKAMEQLVRRELLRFQCEGREYPWPYAVYAGREYKPKPPKAE